MIIVSEWLSSFEPAGFEVSLYLKKTLVAMHSALLPQEVTLWKVKTNHIYCTIINSRFLVDHENCFCLLQSFKILRAKHFFFS